MFRIFMKTILCAMMLVPTIACTQKRAEIWHINRSLLEIISWVDHGASFHRRHRLPC